MSNVRDSCDYLVGSTTDPKPYLEWPSEILLDTTILNWKKSRALSGTVASRRHDLRDCVQDCHNLTIHTFQFQPTPSHLLRALSLSLSLYTQLCGAFPGSPVLYHRFCVDLIWPRIKNFKVHRVNSILVAETVWSLKAREVTLEKKNTTRFGKFWAPILCSPCLTSSQQSSSIKLQILCETVYLQVTLKRLRANRLVGARRKRGFPCFWLLSKWFAIFVISNGLFSMI